VSLRLNFDGWTKLCPFRQGSYHATVEGRRRWLPHLTRATTWLLATVATAVVGAIVTGTRA
jgi:hypothetical protein